MYCAIYFTRIGLLDEKMLMCNVVTALFCFISDIIKEIVSCLCSAFSNFFRFFFGKWESGLEGTNPLGGSQGLGTQPNYEDSDDFQVEHVKMKWLTSCEWGYPLNRDRKLAVG